jgi:hypothetical protein
MYASKCVFKAVCVQEFDHYARSSLTLSDIDIYDGIVVARLAASYSSKGHVGCKVSIRGTFHVLIHADSAIKW